MSILGATYDRIALTYEHIRVKSLALIAFWSGLNTCAAHIKARELSK